MTETPLDEAFQRFRCFTGNWFECLTPEDFSCLTRPLEGKCFLDEAHYFTAIAYALEQRMMADAYLLSVRSAAAAGEKIPEPVLKDQRSFNWGWRLADIESEKPPFVGLVF
jgi:hypothetical protein